MKKLLLLILALTLTFSVCGCNGNSENDKTTETDAHDESQNEMQNEPESDEQLGSEPEMPELTMKEKFIALGFTDEEASQMEEIFTNVGITEIGDIEKAVGTGIDNLQSYRAPVFGSSQLQVNFTVEYRELCYVALSGIASYKPELYISFFGNLKMREKRTVASVDLFERWVDDTDYHQPVEDSYLAKLDYENMEVTEMKENGIE